MQVFINRETLGYDGTQLSSLFSFKSFRIQGDSIAVFRGPCKVALTEMVDLEDVLAEDHIYSEDMLHFIVEHFDMDLEKTVTRQRLLIAIIKENLERRGIKAVHRDGDDLFRETDKLSVSIATLSPVSSMIHTGLNVSSRNTPVPTVDLVQLGVKDILEFGREVAESYSKEVSSIAAARCKVRGVN
ncbi:MAG TPA: DUF366 family protein [Candidatus Deferrimicrobium sp.]|nr:DUF366 family protein [Candidatus Deferrimicrobium sp.]